jgi:molybdopterin molybdotransferase
MIAVEEALKVVLGKCAPLPVVSVDAAAVSLGLTLAEDAVCTLDSPPFAKSMMDGYAIRSSDPAERTVIEEVLAGQTPRKSVGPGEATRIMTGAPLPEGADAVAVIERTDLLSDGRVRVLDRLSAGKNVLPRGAEMMRGDVVFKAGTRLRPGEIGVLAGMGKATVSVHGRPSVAVVSTGDEIVEVWEQPGPGQIRNSNGRMLLAQAARAGATPRAIGIARDNEPHLRTMIDEALAADIVVLSGGVSAGKVDLAPAVLASMGVEQLVNHVRMKPGKPLYFGVKPRASRPAALVFGLPGNPVSSYVCFELFVRPAIAKLMGRPEGSCSVDAALADEVQYPTDRPTYHPARLEASAHGGAVRLVPWLGSADLRGLAAGNALALLTPGEGAHPRGTMVKVLQLDDFN